MKNNGRTRKKYASFFAPFSPDFFTEKGVVLSIYIRPRLSKIPLFKTLYKYA